MKSFFLMFLALNLTSASYSQLTKNNWLVGGSGTFDSYKEYFNNATYSSEAKYTEFDLSANIGYFVADKLAFGLRPSFSSIKGRVTTPGGMRTNTRRYGAGPFGRFYFLEADKPFNLLADVGYQYGITTLDSKKDGHFDSFSALLGPALYFNNCIAIEFLLGYNSKAFFSHESVEHKVKGFQVSIGFQIHLEK